MKTLGSFMLWVLVCTLAALGDEDTFHSKLLTLDEKAIVKFCKKVIARTASGVNVTDLELYSIEHIRNFEGAYGGLFPVELKVTFLLSSSREIYEPAEGAKEKGTRVSFSAVTVNIDPEGAPDKSEARKFAMGCPIDLSKIANPEQGAELSPGYRLPSGNEGTFHSKLVTFDNAAIIKFCKEAIDKGAPKIDSEKLELYSIESIRNFEGSYAPFPVELRATFLLSSSREIDIPPAWSKEKLAKVDYSFVIVSIDPKGDPEKSVPINGSMSFWIDLSKIENAESGPRD